MMMREKDTADYDLERFIEMFDEAMTSNDPRVKNALRQLMMMVILTDARDHEAKQHDDIGPLRRMFEDLNFLKRKLHLLENDIQSIKHRDRERATSKSWTQVPDDYSLNNQVGTLHPHAATEMHQAAIKQGHYNILEQVRAEQVAKKINGGQI